MAKKQGEFPASWVRIDQAAHLRVLLTLALYATSAGTASASQSTIAAATGLSLRSVERAIAALCDAGYLTPFADRTGKQAVYTLHDAPTPPPTPTPGEPPTPAPVVLPTLTTGVPPTSLPGLKALDIITNHVSELTSATANAVSPEPAASGFALEPPPSKKPKRTAQPTLLTAPRDASGDPILDMIGALVKPHLVGLTIKTWRSRNATTARDMAKAGVTPEQATAAWHTLAGRMTSPPIYLRLIVDQLNRAEFRPASSRRFDPGEGMVRDATRPTYEQRIAAAKAAKGVRTDAL